MGLSNPTNDPEFRFASQIEPTVDETVRTCSVPIFAANLQAERRVGNIVVVDGAPISGVASGTLFAIGNQHFVVTAAHVLRDFRTDVLQIRIGMGYPERPQPLLVTEDNSAVVDDGDVAVVLLSPENAQRFPGKRVLTLADVTLDPNVDECRCVLFGYVWDGTQPSHDFAQLLVHNFKYWSQRHRGNIASATYDPRRHTLVEYHRLARTIPDGVQRENPLSLGGLSGSALWRVFRPRQVEGGWTPEQMKVVAVENVVYGGRIIGCTNFSEVLPLFASIAPEVGPQIEHARQPQR